MLAALSRPTPSWTEALTRLSPVPIGKILGYATVHTGVPAVVVCALAIVISYRLAKRTVRFAVEVGLVLGALSVASYFGWVRL